MIRLFFYVLGYQDTDVMLVFKKIWRPVLFQGSLKNKKYFEGWYYKQTSGDEKTIISFIPGISLFDRDRHAFLQYILVTDDEGNKTTRTGYLKYDIDSFRAFTQPFEISVGDSTFSETHLTVNLNDQNLTIEGKVQFGPLLPIKTSLFMPNIMGPFAYFPKMECYHGIISMNHSLSGNLIINGKDTDFDSGKGYFEKDWGTSFPKEYVWIQSNHFQSLDTSLFLSAAHIPFMGSAFAGFICNLTLNGQEYRFATYNKSRLKINKVNQEEISISLSGPHAALNIEARNNNPGKLVAPVFGNMSRIIKEGISGEVRIELVDKSGMIYEDIGRLAGIEVVGDEHHNNHKCCE